MATVTESSDERLLDILRREGASSVSEIATATEVTATAVRQRLNRLMAEGLIERSLRRAPRGRPSHCYSLTEKARRQAGTNFADLAIVLWNEIRAIRDPAVRRGLLERLARTMADSYGSAVNGESTSERMQSVVELFADRHVRLEVDQSGQLPVLKAVECPYPELAEKDRGICALEGMLFSALLDTDVKLSHCRLDGHHCCEFQSN